MPGEAKVTMEPIAEKGTKCPTKDGTKKKVIDTLIRFDEVTFPRYGSESELDAIEPEYSLKKLDVQVDSSEKFRNSVTGLPENLVHMFVDVDVTCSVTFNEGNTGLRIHARLKLKNEVEQSSRMFFKQEDAEIPLQQEITLKLNEFILIMQNTYGKRFIFDNSDDSDDDYDW